MTLIPFAPYGCASRDGVYFVLSLSLFLSVSLTLLLISELACIARTPEKLSMSCHLLEPSTSQESPEGEMELL
jgi:hypothetical protein